MRCTAGHGQRNSCDHWRGTVGRGWVRPRCLSAHRTAPMRAPSLSSRMPVGQTYGSSWPRTIQTARASRHTTSNATFCRTMAATALARAITGAASSAASGRPHPGRTCAVSSPLCCRPDGCRPPPPRALASRDDERQRRCHRQVYHLRALRGCNAVDRAGYNAAVLVRAAQQLPVEQEAGGRGGQLRAGRLGQARPSAAVRPARSAPDGTMTGCSSEGSSSRSESLTDMACPWPQGDTCPASLAEQRARPR